MRIIYSGFDTISFAVKGALDPTAIKRMAAGKILAIKDQNSVPYAAKGLRFPALIMGQGMKGGYAFVLTTGPLGQTVSFKDNLVRDQWNGFVKIRALSLAVHGWRIAIQMALDTLMHLGFHVAGISMNRVDYCMDFLNAKFTLDPAYFVAHSRVKKTGYYTSDQRNDPSLTRVNNAEIIRSVSRGDTCESVMAGMMPGRQVIVYDKRREAIDKRNDTWFEIWGIDRGDITQTVHRVELRAGKAELLKYGIRTIEDFESSIGDVFAKAVTAIRYVMPSDKDSNITRQPLHPLWTHVQAHVGTHLLDHTSGVTETRLIYVLREQKAREYKAQVMGNIAGLSVCKRVDFEDIPEIIPDMLRADLQTGTNDPDHPFRKTHLRARDKLRFMDEGNREA